MHRQLQIEKNMSYPPSTFRVGETAIESSPPPHIAEDDGPPYHMDSALVIYRNFQKECLSKLHICDMQFADVACALKTQTAIV